MPVQEALSFNDLTYLNSSPSAVRAYFETAYSKNPDGISVNSETYYYAVTPAITAQYGHPCYKTLGPFNYVTNPSAPPTSAIVGSNYAINNGDDPAQVSLTVEGAWSDATSWSSETTTGLTLSSEFTIEGVFKTGASFSVSTTVGQSSSQSTSRSSSSTVTVTVPGRSKRKVSMVGTMSDESMSFTAPIAVQGYFGANFPDRVNGHYFWFADASSALPKTSGTIQGTIRRTSVFNVQTEIGPVESLS
ncbi:hypothetical protein [Massilia antarctica]|uniref:hypothetical protein n=1 Tax=Massilia antarctica TaxID=2765360 RepID=UPI00226DB3A5|nr:hypothetical protein [Massilia sp. H27-R4]MCY0910541.1 hypothetical protein [Massilia sp. H27-R4]